MPLLADFLLDLLNGLTYKGKFKAEGKRKHCQLKHAQSSWLNKKRFALRTYQD